MALWLIRAGKHGDHEQKFLDETRVYVTWDKLDADLSKLQNVAALRALLQHTHTDFGTKKIINHASQIWPFVHDMKPGDWAVVPAKNKRSIHIAEIAGPYVYVAGGPDLTRTSTIAR